MTVSLIGEDQVMECDGPSCSARLWKRGPLSDPLVVQAREAGWGTFKGGKHFCPEHVRSRHVGTDVGIRAFQRISGERARRWHGDDDWTPERWLGALLGELGEAANDLKKIWRAEDGIANDGDPSVEELRASIGVELADVQAYLVCLANSLGVDLASETAAKFNRVSERYGFPERVELPPDP